MTYQLERLVREMRTRAHGRSKPAPPGRPVAPPDAVADQIRNAHAAGKSFAQIARDLNASRVPTAHGGAQWWRSSVRAVLGREHRERTRLP